MKVKDVVRSVAEVLRLTDAIDFCDGKNTAASGQKAKGEEDTERLVKLFNRVERELAVSCLPPIAEERAEVRGGKLPYSALSKTFSRLIFVKDDSGRRATYVAEDDGIRTAEKKISVCYEYEPKEKKLSDDGEYASGMPSKVIATGMIAEYYLGKQMFEEAAIYAREYDAAAELTRRLRRGGRLRGRNWR